MDNINSIQRFLDDDGKINIWPSKKDVKIEILKYLSSNFEYGRFYSEKEVNAIINENHTFNDYFLLRRGMVDYKFLSRTKDGAKYWRNKNE